MTLISETTSLLPQRQLHLGTSNNAWSIDINGTKEGGRNVKIFLVLVVAVAVALSILARRIPPSEHEQTQIGLTSYPFQRGSALKEVPDVPVSELARRDDDPLSLGNEASLSLLDDWKSQIQQSSNNFGFREKAQGLSSTLKSWWHASDTESGLLVNTTVENARRFGEHVTSWWHLVEEKGKSTISSESLGEKERALEQNFQKWWEGANNVEHSWWNATISQLQHDGQASREWMKGLQQNTEATVQKSQEWINGAAHSIENEEENLVGKEHDLWNHTKSDVKDGERAAKERFDLWWNITKTVAQNTLNTTSATEETWWNASESWFRNHVNNHLVEPPKELLYLNSTLAYSMLMNGMHWFDYSSDFFLMLSGWDVQINQAYCSIASAAAVVNSFRPYVDLPVDKAYDPYAYATQKSLLDNRCVQHTVVLYNATYDGVTHTPGGLTLAQTKSLLDCHLGDEWTVTAIHVDPEQVTIDDVRRELSEALKDPRKRVLVNFDRHELGQSGGGHFSPIGSYAMREDSFLMMDVAKYKYPPVWVPIDRLYISMATLDPCGEWGYPSAQDNLCDDERPSTVHEYERAMKKLGCRAKYRGLIIVEKKDPYSTPGI